MPIEGIAAAIRQVIEQTGFIGQELRMYLCEGQTATIEKVAGPRPRLWRGKRCGQRPPATDGRETGEGGALVYFTLK